jgi:type IV pilus assembly protein PilN
VIRVNLLGERKSLKKKTTFQLGQKLTVGCSLILVVAGVFIGWRYWSLGQTSSQLDADLASAQKETARLHSLIAQVQQFEQRKTQLQQRVTLIEQLREDQTGPVHMLDQISRALPPLLWLTGMKQTPAANDVLIEGRGLTMTGLSDFVTNLEASGYFQRSVEIDSTTTETTPTGEMIKFQIKAVFQPLNGNKPVPAAGAPAPAHGA